MKDRLSLKYAIEWLASFFALVAALAVLQTFLIGRHFVIPTLILIPTVLFSNLAYYGFKDRTWAKYMLFWLGFIFNCYTFFALFWAQKFREIMGDAFEFVWLPLVLIVTFLVYQYQNKNGLFKSNTS